MPKTIKPPSYRRHRASGQAVVTLNGRDHYLGTYGTKTSRDAYDRHIAEWLAGGRRLLINAESSITVTELAAAYWRFAKGYYRKNGAPTVELAKIKATIRPLKRLYGSTSAAEFGPLALKSLRQEIIRGGYRRRAPGGAQTKHMYTRGHVNQTIGRVKRLFRWGVENELVPPSVYHGLQAVAGLKCGRTEAREASPVRPVPEEHITQVLPLVPRPVRAMIELQLLTGMRPSEVRLISGANLDTAGRVWTYRPSVHKTQHFGRERVVYLGPRAQGVVRPFLKTDTTAYLFSPKDAIAEWNAEKRRHRKTPVQPSQRDRSKSNPERRPGDCYRADSYRWAIRRACLAADVPAWGPGRLRHNAGTRFRKEYGLEVAQVVLGHKSAEVTQVYAERDKERALAVVAKIG
ncbi:MAG: site-specific integrase [Phycisphaerales bacterium]|nr:MAG: site-specific integrase [Phycisphaerales bacterium]